MKKGNLMYLIDKITGKKIWKYHLVDESLAVASAGMSATTGLDQRCIIFTIHLTSLAGHTSLCRSLFDTVESYFLEKRWKRRSASYSGLSSFIDVNGSKFSGADRDHTQVHCHGFIFIPWNVTYEGARELMRRLKAAAMQTTHEGTFVVRDNSKAIEFQAFDNSRTDSSLVDWTEYAQKEAARVTTEGNPMIFLPFDCRDDFGEKIANHIEKKRDKTLALLRSNERFRVLSYL